jgi:hypothetical protein
MPDERYRIAQMTVEKTNLKKGGRPHKHNEMLTVHGRPITTRRTGLIIVSSKTSKQAGRFGLFYINVFGNVFFIFFLDLENH